MLTCTHFKDYFDYLQSSWNDITNVTNPLNPFPSSEETRNNNAQKTRKLENRDSLSQEENYNAFSSRNFQYAATDAKKCFCQTFLPIFSPIKESIIQPNFP